jgi:hypothetical protein
VVAQHHDSDAADTARHARLPERGRAVRDVLAELRLERAT